MSLDVRVGEWVCFQQLGLPCYGRVDYVRAMQFAPETEVVTTAGTCAMKDILEVRHKDKEQP